MDVNAALQKPIGTDPSVLQWTRHRNPARPAARPVKQKVMRTTDEHRSCDRAQSHGACRGKRESVKLGIPREPTRRQSTAVGYHVDRRSSWAAMLPRMPPAMLDPWVWPGLAAVGNCHLAERQNLIGCTPHCHSFGRSAHVPLKAEHCVTCMEWMCEMFAMNRQFVLTFL